MHTRGVTATPLRVVTTSPPRVCIIFLIIQRPVVNYSLHIPQSYEALCSQPELVTSPAVLVNPDFSFEMVSRKLTYLYEDIKDLCQKKLEKLSNKGKSSSEYVWNSMLTKHFSVKLQYIPG